MTPSAGTEGISDFLDETMAVGVLFTLRALSY